MLNSVRFMISVQLVLRFAMKTSNLKANNSNDANDKYSSFNAHQLTYILAFSKHTNISLLVFNKLC